MYYYFFFILAFITIPFMLFLGVLLLHGSSDDFQKVGSHLAQRLFDSVPQVRRVVSLCAGNLLLNWRYGESNAPLLVPLLLTRYKSTTTLLISGHFFKKILLFFCYPGQCFLIAYRDRRTGCELSLWVA